MQQPSNQPTNKPSSQPARLLQWSAIVQEDEEFAQNCEYKRNHVIMKCAYTDIGRNSHKTTSTTSISRHLATTTTTQTAAAGKKLTVEIFLSDIEKWPVTFYGFFWVKVSFRFLLPAFCWCCCCCCCCNLDPFNEQHNNNSTFIQRVEKILQLTLKLNTELAYQAYGPSDLAS